MLTSKDLSQIKNIVEEVVEQKLEQKLDDRFSKFETKLDQKLDDRLGKFETKLDQKLDKRLKPIEKTLKKIQKDLLVSFNFADKSLLDHEGRIRKVESVLNIPQAF